MVRFQKLYVDLVTPDGVACIAYAARLRLAGITLSPAGVERYDAVGRRDVRRGAARLELSAEPGARSLEAVQLDLPDGAHVLEVRPEAGEIVPDVDPPPDIAWRVKVTRAHVRLSRVDGGESVEGVGYADWVELGRAPRALGLDTLDWGRLHLEAGTFVYSRVRRKDGSRWQPAFWWPVGGRQRPVHDWSLHVDDGTGRTLVETETLGEPFLLEPAHALHAGDAVDPARFPAWVERALTRRLAGPVRERRWLSRVQTRAFGGGWAVHESVRFGEARTETFQ